MKYSVQIERASMLLLFPVVFVCVCVGGGGGKSDI